jgi:hypothetical protein
MSVGIVSMMEEAQNAISSHFVQNYHIVVFFEFTV